MKKILETLEDKWTEYLLEIVVIIIGILGAFVLNNWYENQKEIKKAISVLKTIESNLQSDLESTNNQFNELKDRNEYWIRLLADPNDSLSRQFILMVNSSFPTVNRSGYSIALADNSLGNILNKDLRNSLSNYYEYDISLKTLRLLLNNQSQNLMLEVVRQGMALKYPRFEDRVTYLLQDPSFKEYVASYMRVTGIILRIQERRATEIKGLLNDINDYLENTIN